MTPASFTQWETIMTRRDVHGADDPKINHEHLDCPDLFCCDCECHTCKRAWHAAGRPSCHDCPQHKPAEAARESGAPGAASAQAADVPRDLSNYHVTGTVTFRFYTCVKAENETAAIRAAAKMGAHYLIQRSSGPTIDIDGCGPLTTVSEGESK